MVAPCGFTICLGLKWHCMSHASTRYDSCSIQDVSDLFEEAMYQGTGDLERKTGHANVVRVILRQISCYSRVEFDSCYCRYVTTTPAWPWLCAEYAIWRLESSSHFLPN